MSKVDKVYHNLLEAIIEDGYDYETDNRKGISCKQLSSYNLEIPLDNFPLLTTKKVFTKGIVGELIWFLRGDSNIKYLVDNNINIWNKDAYNWYVKKHKNVSTSYEKWMAALKNSHAGKSLGNVGKNYGVQWRNWTKLDNLILNLKEEEEIDFTDSVLNISSELDQIENLINNLRKENPITRRHIVTAWNPSELEETALPPCFTEETLINTSLGYKKISEVIENDLVLTKEGDYQKVYKKMITPYEGTLIGLGVKGRTDIIKCTPNHEFFIKDKGWMQSLFVEEGDFVGVPINKREEIPFHTWNIKQNQFVNINKSKKLDNKNLWWLMGYFVGDGWVSNNKNDINLAISDEEYDLVYSKIKDVIPSLNKGQISGKSARYYFNSVEFATLFRKFGHKAKNKFIPEFILNAPKEYLIQFIEGYKMADGTKRNDIYQFGTISESLAYGIQIILSKLNIPSSVNKTKKEKYKVIEGRKVKQKDFYYIIESYKRESLDVIVEKNIIWYRVKNKYLFKDIKTNVYNISVANSHTYTAYNIINHNCHWSFEILVEPLTIKEQSDLALDLAIKEAKKTGKANINKAYHSCPRYQFTLKWHQRSVDTFLGLPFNIASYALLGYILEELTGHRFKGIIGDLSNVHIYSPHIDAVNEQLQNNTEKYNGASLVISDRLKKVFKDFREGEIKIHEVFTNMEISDFSFENYQSYNAIKASMFEAN